MIIHCPNCDAIMDVVNSEFAEPFVACPTCHYEFENPAVVEYGQRCWPDDDDRNVDITEQ